LLEQSGLIDSAVQGNVQRLVHLREEFHGKCTESTGELAALLGVLKVDKIDVWKLQQQRKMNGCTVQDELSLEHLQVWCEELALLAWALVQQLREFERFKAQNPALELDVRPLKEEVLGILKDLLNSSFLVTGQPPQVMKKGTRFPTALTVALLAGTRLAVGMSPAEVQTVIINEGQAKSLPVADLVEPSGVIDNNKTRLELGQVEGQVGKRLLAHFRSIQLKSIVRDDKKSGNAASISVMEEKFCLHFKAEVTVGDYRIPVRLY
jgi:hypothetical protein